MTNLLDEAVKELREEKEKRVKEFIKQKLMHNEDLEVRIRDLKSTQESEHRKLKEFLELPLEEAYNQINN